MHSTDPKHLESFLKTWNEGYLKVKNILKYLSTYHDVLKKINITDILDPANLDSSQAEWIWLCSKFKHPLERDFFKPYWIPIVKDSLDYFIDISDDAYPIFETNYFFLEPYRWYKNYLTHNVIDLLLALDENINYDEIADWNEKQHWNTIEELFEKRRDLGFEGVLHVKKVSLKEIPSDNESTVEFTYHDEDARLIVEGVNALIVGLLPHEMNIELKSLCVKYGDEFSDFGRVRNIRDMVFFLRELGHKRISNYSVELLDNAGTIFFDNNRVIMNITNKFDTNKIINLIKQLM
jgi:hypothetical protein